MQLGRKDASVNTSRQWLNDLIIVKGSFTEVSRTAHSKRGAQNRLLAAGMYYQKS